LGKKTSDETISHELVPPHVVLSAEQKAKVLDKYRATDVQFPKILAADPALRGLSAKAGDLIQIKRKDFTGEYYYYRFVVSGEK
jgi:DNA-directed RNA polymerase I, II, and III subunit RPABC1